MLAMIIADCVAVEVARDVELVVVDVETAAVVLGVMLVTVSDKISAYFKS